MPIGRRMELLKWASEEQGRYLIEDDYDSEFRYKGKPIPSLQASDTDGRVVYIGTFSKAIAPAIRISYMVLPYPLLERYRSRCSFYSSTVSRIDQTILNEFIRDGYFERYLNKMRKLYREKHDLILNVLKPFEKDFRISGSNAGLHIIMTDKQRRAEEDLARMAADVKVKVYRMQDFRMKNLEPNNGGTENVGNMQTDEPAMLILGYAALTPEEIREGTALLKKAWIP